MKFFDSIQRWLAALVHWCKGEHIPPHAVTYHFPIQSFEMRDGLKLKGNLFMTNVEITVTQGFGFTIGSPVDGKGNPARIDGDIRFTVEDTNPEPVLIFEPAPEGNGGTVKATGKIGIALVRISADADLTGETREIGDTIQVNVVAGAAVGFNVVIGQVFELGV